MNVLSQAQLLMKNAGFLTWPLLSERGEALCFEDEAVVGFIFDFTSAQVLLDQHIATERSALNTYAPALRAAKDKAWNVYSVFLTSDNPDPDFERTVLAIEENFTMTRKIARCGVSSVESLRAALFPLLPIFSKPKVNNLDFTQVFSDRLTAIVRPEIVSAFHSAAPNDFVRIVTEAQP